MHNNFGNYDNNNLNDNSFINLNHNYNDIPIVSDFYSAPSFAPSPTSTPTLPSRKIYSEGVIAPQRVSFEVEDVEAEAIIEKRESVFNRQNCVYLEELVQDLMARVGAKDAPRFAVLSQHHAQKIVMCGFAYNDIIEIFEYRAATNINFAINICRRILLDLISAAANFAIGKNSYNGKYKELDKKSYIIRYKQSPQTGEIIVLHIRSASRHMQGKHLNVAGIIAPSVLLVVSLLLIAITLLNPYVGFLVGFVLIVFALYLPQVFALPIVGIVLSINGYMKCRHGRPSQKRRSIILTTIGIIVSVLSIVAPIFFFMAL